MIDFGKPIETSASPGRLELGAAMHVIAAIIGGLIMGLIIGLLARLIMPGKQNVSPQSS
jgi:uncharacterized membrane protein YeaQ/YmgE (transglycosylase-associated protein family)